MQGPAVKVFAASSLTDVFQEIADAFEEAYPRLSVSFNFASSTALRTQIEHGASADVYASADTFNMDRAKKASLIAAPSKIFATNRLAVIVRYSDTRIDSLADLIEPELRLVIAAPQTPIGIYTHNALNRLASDRTYGPRFVAGITQNVVSQGLNVRHTVAKVRLGEADAAIGYMTDATADKEANLRAVPLFDDFSNVPAYPIAVVKDPTSLDSAQAFVDFVLSDTGQRILRSHGFGPP